MFKVINLETILQTSSLTQSLITKLRASISDNTLKRASMHLLDWLACSVAARQSPLSQKLKTAYGRSPEVGLFAKREGHELPQHIAFLASLGHQLEMDDVHKASTLHPGPIACPVALCLAQQTDAKPKTLLSSIVVAYETIIRIGEALGRSHYQYFHTTSTCGSFGAASAAAILYKLTEQQWLWALGNAGTRTGGLWQMRHENVDSKAIHNAQAARTGWEAAHFARENISGPAFILEGPQGLFTALSDDAEPSRITQDQPTWLIEAMSIKPWPCCRHIHAAIDALAIALESHNRQDIETVEVRTYADALKFCDIPEPNSEQQAKFSIQHALAVMISQNQLTLSDFSKAAINNSDYVHWRSRITVTECDDANTRYPEHFSAQVAIHGKSGNVSRHTCPDAWGDPENPLHFDDLINKVKLLFDSANVNAGTTQNVIEAIVELPHQSTCLNLWKALNEIPH